MSDVNKELMRAVNKVTLAVGYSEGVRLTREETEALYLEIPMTLILTAYHQLKGESNDLRLS